jgi:hypothetical protein
LRALTRRTSEVITSPLRFVPRHTP